MVSRSDHLHHAMRLRTLSGRVHQRGLRVCKFRKSKTILLLVFCFVRYSNVSSKPLYPHTLPYPSKMLIFSWMEGRPCDDCQRDLFTRIQLGDYDFPEEEWGMISQVEKAQNPNSGNPPIANLFFLEKIQPCDNIKTVISYRRAVV